MPPKGRPRGARRLREAEGVAQANSRRINPSRKKRIAKVKKDPYNSMVPFGKTSEPFANVKYTTLKYSQTDTYTAGASGITGVEQAFRLNSMFDPDFTGAGHQPYGYDQLALLYKKYKVTSVDIAIKATDPSEDGMFICAMVGSFNNIYTLAGRSYDQVNEKPNAMTRAVNNTGSQQSTVRQHVPLWKVTGLSKAQYDANITDYSGLFAGPTVTDTPWLRVNAGSVRGLTGGTIKIQVEIIFHVQCYERLTLNQS